jgi:hypothetical protein
VHEDAFLQLPGGKLHFGSRVGAYGFQRISQGGILGVNSQQVVAKLDFQFGL